MQEYRFQWDYRKAKSNKRKHGISFELACTVLRDPYALSIFDEQHSVEEDRWITMGIAATGALLVVNHTFERASDSVCVVRIISSRKATAKETSQYRDSTI